MLTQCFPPRIGGIENLVFNLSLHLSKYEKVLVLADQHNIINEIKFDKNFKKDLIIKRFGGLKYFRKRNKFRELKKINDLRKIKAIICDSWKSIEYPILKLKNKNFPIFTLVHGNEVIIKNSIHKNRVSKTLALVDKIICNSKYTETLVHKLNSQLKNTQIIYPGVPTFENIESEKVKSINGNPILLTLARLEKRKGHAKILNVISKLKKIYPNICYIIAGEGKELKYLKMLSKKLNIKENVFFLGAINDNQKKYIFSITDIMVMPTIDESEKFSIEGFGIVYIEAALFGIPSIASNIGGTNEAVLNNKTGIILKNLNDLEKEIANLLQSKDERKRLGDNAKKRVINDLLWTNQIQKYFSLISNFSN